MNYYKRHIGDYAAATRHLSLLEHGVYCLLLDVYYTSEKALPADPKAVSRLISAKSRDEREAVETILGEFFEKFDDGWHQTRCDEEIHHKQAKADVNQALGRLGGRPKQISDSVIPDNPNGIKQITDSVLVDETQRNPSHKPIANSQYLDTPDGVSAPGKPAALPDCPHIALLDVFAKQLPELPQPKRELWAGKNAEAMRARWRWVLTAKKKNGERYAMTEADALDWFERYFAYVGRSDFLSGRSGKWGGCDLGWLLKADNFAKVVQGNYENKAVTA